MNNNWNIKKICNTIWQLEKDHNLLDLEIQGVKIWQYWRNEIYLSIIKEKGLQKEIHPDIENKSRLAKLMNNFNIVKYAILNNPFNYYEKTDSIIIPHQRVNKVNNEYIDIYTNHLVKELEKSEEKIFIIEKPYKGTHLAKRVNNKGYVEYINLKAFINRQFLKLSLTNEEQNQLQEINNLLIEHFEVDLKLKRLFVKLIKRFKTKYDLYKKLFSKLQPQKLYLTINYSNQEAIKACKDLGIETIELQHGNISRYHLGYSYPNYANELNYFPDKLYCWGNFWPEITPLPLNPENIINYGFNYFREIKDNYNSQNKISNQIVVLAQGSISDNLPELILRHIDELKDYKIIYKLHPSQFNSENINIENLSKYNNVEIMKDEDLYSILAESLYLIGGYSTAIYEGIAMNCKPIIADLPGIENMEEVIERFNIPVLNSESNIPDIINQANNCNIDFSNFF